MAVNISFNFSSHTRVVNTSEQLDSVRDYRLKRLIISILDQSDPDREKTEQEVESYVQQIFSSTEWSYKSQQVSLLRSIQSKTGKCLSASDLKEFNQYIKTYCINRGDLQSSYLKLSEQLVKSYNFTGSSISDVLTQLGEWFERIHSYSDKPGFHDQHYYLAVLLEHCQDFSRAEVINELFAAYRGNLSVLAKKVLEEGYAEADLSLDEFIDVKTSANQRLSNITEAESDLVFSAIFNEQYSRHDRSLRDFEINDTVSKFNAVHQNQSVFEYVCKLIKAKKSDEGFSGIAKKIPDNQRSLRYTCDLMGRLSTVTSDLAEQIAQIFSVAPGKKSVSIYDNRNLHELIEQIGEKSTSLSDKEVIVFFSSFNEILRDYDEQVACSAISGLFHIQTCLDTNIPADKLMPLFRYLVESNFKNNNNNLIYNLSRFSKYLKDEAVTLSEDQLEILLIICQPKEIPVKEIPVYYSCLVSAKSPDELNLTELTKLLEESDEAKIKRIQKLLLCRQFSIDDLDLLTESDELTDFAIIFEQDHHPLSEKELKKLKSIKNKNSLRNIYELTGKKESFFENLDQHMIQLAKLTEPEKNIFLLILKDQDFNYEFYLQYLSLVKSLLSLCEKEDYRGQIFLEEKSLTSLYNYLQLNEVDQSHLEQIVKSANELGDLRVVIDPALPSCLSERFKFIEQVKQSGAGDFSGSYLSKIYDLLLETQSNKEEISLNKLQDFFARLLIARSDSQPEIDVIKNSILPAYVSILEKNNYLDSTGLDSLTINYFRDCNTKTGNAYSYWAVSLYQSLARAYCNSEVQLEDRYFGIVAEYMKNKNYGGSENLTRTKWENFFDSIHYLKLHQFELTDNDCHELCRVFLLNRMTSQSFTRFCEILNSEITTEILSALTKISSNQQVTEDVEWFNKNLFSSLNSVLEKCNEDRVQIFEELIMITSSDRKNNVNIMSALEKLSGISVDKLKKLKPILEAFPKKESLAPLANLIIKLKEDFGIDDISNFVFILERLTSFLKANPEHKFTECIDAFEVIESN